MSTLFVAGSGTDVGKTHVICALVGALRARGGAVEAFKPAVSFFDESDWAKSDSGRLLSALGRPLDTVNLDALSPFRFAAPLSTDAAARAEGRRLDLADLTAACRAAQTKAGEAPLLIEGAGGVMSPIAEGATNLDLMAALGAPVLLVGGNYLGTISHVLTAAQVIQARGLTLLGVVLSETGIEPPLAANAEAIGAFLPGAQVIEAGGAAPWADRLADLVAACELSLKVSSPVSEAQTGEVDWGPSKAGEETVGAC